MKHNFRLLKPEEIEVRVGQVSDGKASLLLYKDARCDMAILDEVYDGQWQRDHKEVKGNMYAGVAVWDSDLSQWIWRWDCGTESNTEKEKGEASDAFKRACVNLGIGRELYTAPPIWVQAETMLDGKSHKLKNKFQFSGCNVTSINYSDDRKISALEIVDRRGSSIFSWGKPQQKKGKAKVKTEDVSAPSESTSAHGKTIALTQASEIRKLANEVGSKILDICAAYKIKALEEMTEEQYRDCKRKLEYKKEKK